MATSTKTRSKTIADVIASAEEQVNKDIEPVKAEIAGIDAQLPAIRERMTDAADQAGETEDIRVRWRRGEDVPALDYLLSQAEDAKAEELATGLVRKRDQLRKVLPADNTIIAEHIKSVFESILPGVPVIATNAPMRTWQQNVPEGAVAVVLVQQPGLTVDPFTSAMSGDVTAYYVRSVLHRSIEVQALEDAGRTLKRPFEVRSNTPSNSPAKPNGCVIDAMKVRIDGVIDGLPVIRKVETTSLVPTWVTLILGAQDIGRVNYTTGRITSSREWNGPGSFRATHGGTDVKVYAPTGREKTHDDGTRTVTVTNRVMLTGANPDEFTQALQEQADRHAGTVLVGVGLLDSTKVEFEPPSNIHADTFAIDVTQTYQSKFADSDSSWVEQRAKEQAEAEAEQQARELRRVAGEERREATRKRVHPAERMSER